MDSAGNLYVADALNHRIQKFNSSQVYTKTFGVSYIPYVSDGYHFNGPFDVAVDNYGKIAVVEGWWYGHRLIVLDSEGDPQFIIGEAGISGSDNAHFNDPQGVAFDTEGKIYVGDCWNHRVQIFDINGEYLSTLGTGYGQGNGQFFCPAGLSFDNSGNLYVADGIGSSVFVYDTGGNFLYTYADINDGLLSPFGIEFRGDHLFIVGQDLTFDFGVLEFTVEEGSTYLHPLVNIFLLFDREPPLGKIAGNAAADRLSIRGTMEAPGTAGIVELTLSRVAVP